jgi:hypothetical protein
MFVKTLEVDEFSLVLREGGKKITGPVATVWRSHWAHPTKTSSSAEPLSNTLNTMLRFLRLEGVSVSKKKEDDTLQHGLVSATPDIKNELSM